MNISKYVLAASLAAGLSLTTTASARELRVAFGIGGQKAIEAGLNTFTDGLGVATGGAHTGKLYVASLLNLQESMAGVRDGVSDVSYVVIAFHRKEFPYANIVVDMGATTADPVAMTAASNEFMLTCAPCMKEFTDQKQVFLGFFAAGPYYLSTKTPVADVADYKGKKFRGFGSFARWLEQMGAVTVSVQASEVYESLSQGHLDGNIQPLDNLRSLSYGEVTDYVVDLPLGLNPGNAMFNMNIDLWKSLTPEQRKNVFLLAGKSEAVTAVEFYNTEKSHLKNLEPLGVAAVEPTEAVLKKMEAFRASEAELAAKTNEEQYGIADARDQVARLQSLIRKWEGLVATIDTSDVAAVQKLFEDELYGKLDPETFAN